MVNMVSKFNKNAIINGFIHYYCLVCETYFRTEEAAEQHMEKQVHKYNLETSTSVEKYKDDCVRKVKAGYFCEYCNVLLPTRAKVNLHIEEEMHQNNKGITLLKYVEDDVVTFNDVVIKEEAWHGFTGDTCAICNCDVEDFAAHKSDHAHILKLVQGRIQFGTNNKLYRNVDETAFQCLTCNKILAMSTFEKHFNDSEHQQIYISCCHRKIKDSNSSPLEKKDSLFNTTEDKKTNNVTPTSIETSLIENTSNSNILDSISEFQKNYIDIQLEYEKVFCKKCYVDVSFDYNKIKNHILQHKNKNISPLSSPAKVNHNHKTTNVKPQTKSYNGTLDTDMKYLTFYPNTISVENVNKERLQSRVTAQNTNTKHTKGQESVITIETFARNNKISYIAGHAEAHCTVCNVKLPASLRNMTEHVNGAQHKKPKRLGADLPKEQINKFVKEWIRIEKGGYDVVVINDEYCITALSFVMITKEASELTCLYCQTSLSAINITGHMKTSNHHEAMSRMPVVLRDDDEFIREIRSGMYHCGYCHMVVGDWSNFEEHMKCDSHKEEKKAMKNRLKALRPGLREHRREKEMRDMFNRMRNNHYFPWYWMYL